MMINGETNIIGFFGSTYKASKMFAMYNAAFKDLNLNFVYIPFVVDDLEKAVEGIRHLGIKGIGVTVPYKESIIKYIDELDDNAERIGAVNVVINNNGVLIGGNTDGLGCVKALREVTNVRGKKIILLGSGGAAKAVVFTLTEAKGKVTVLNRTKSEADKLAARIGCKSDTLESTNDEIKNADIIINATTVGMKPDINTTLVPKELLRPDMIIMDLVANPDNTKLLSDAKEAGCKIVYGKRMLFWQAVFKFKMFTGIDAPVEVMEEALN